jgi:cytochrome P450
MPYASKMVKESLRMASVVPWFPRLVLQDCEMEGYKIKKGWNINIDARSIHLDPTVYSEPHKFNPLRFEVNKPQFKVNILKFTVPLFKCFWFYLINLN